MLYNKIKSAHYDNVFTADKDIVLKKRTMWANIRIFIFLLLIPSYLGISSFLNFNEFYVMKKQQLLLNSTITAIYCIIFGLTAFIGVVHGGESTESLDNQYLIHYKLTNVHTHVEMQPMDEEMGSKYATIKDNILPCKETIYSVNPYRSKHNDKNNEKCKWRKTNDLIKRIFGYHV